MDGPFTVMERGDVMGCLEARLAVGDTMLNYC